MKSIYFFLMVINLWKTFAQDCGTPIISNGGISPKSSTLNGATAEAKCNSGYVGGGNITCQSSGTWTVLQTPCTAVDCGKLIVANGVFSGDTFYKGSALVTCKAGYDGSGLAICGATGTWRAEPKCTAKDCGTPIIPNGKLSAESSTLFEGTATVVCAIGYEGGGTARCLSNGTWASLLPICKPVDCETPNITNGFLIAGSSTEFAGSAIVSCNTGYQLAGTNRARCLSDGNWDTLPICHLADCGQLTDPYHGSVIYSTTTYQSVAKYRCGSLWQLNGSDTLTCGAGGSWVPDPATCDDIDCPPLATPTNGVISTAAVKVGTIVSLSCRPSYTLFGDERFHCETGGTWNVSNIGTCVKDCETPKSPVYGNVTYSGTAVGSKARYRCEPGYTIVGAEIRVCGENGTWSDTIPICLSHETTTTDINPIVEVATKTPAMSLNNEDTKIYSYVATGSIIFFAIVILAASALIFFRQILKKVIKQMMTPQNNLAIETYSRSNHHSEEFSFISDMGLPRHSSIQKKSDPMFSNEFIFYNGRSQTHACVREGTGSCFINF